jgi:hypothetical protein
MQDPFALTRHRAADQIDDDMRRYEPALWWSVALAAVLLHAWVALRLVGLPRLGGVATVDSLHIQRASSIALDAGGVPLCESLPTS